jgi:uncharacterized protein (DUF1778 family)
VLSKPEESVVPHAARSERRRGNSAPDVKNEVIQIRASADTKAILNRAASLRGQKLSEFMLDSARRQAEETILDQRVFFLDPDAHRRFLALLDAPAKPSADVRKRLGRKAPWDR